MRLGWLKKINRVFTKMWMFKTYRFGQSNETSCRHDKL